MRAKNSRENGRGLHSLFSSASFLEKFDVFYANLRLALIVDGTLHLMISKLGIFLIFSKKKIYIKRGSNLLNDSIPFLEWVNIYVMF